MGCKVDHRGIYASDTSRACLFICFFVIIVAYLLTSGSLFVCSLNHLFIRSFILCYCYCCNFAIVDAVVISLSLPLSSPLVGLWERYKDDYIISFRKRYFWVTSDTYFFFASAILVFICASALASDASPCIFLNSTFSRNDSQLKAGKKTMGKRPLLLHYDGETGTLPSFLILLSC